MLILNQKDIENIAEPFQLVSAIEKAYIIQQHEKTCMPGRMHLEYNKNTLLVMPAFIESISGTKLVSLFPENIKHKKPVLNGAMLLNNSQTGEPLALLNAGKLTALRTAAVSAVAVKYLAPFMVQTMGIIGAGIQAYHHAIILSHQRPFKKLTLFDKNISKAEVLKERLESDLPNIHIQIAENSNQLVLDSDVIITATPSNKPVFDINPDKVNNKTFIAIGSYKPEMQEIPLSLFKKINKVYVDTSHAMQESGDIKIPIEKNLIKKENIIAFNSVLTSGELVNPEPVSLFKSVGMALFDLTVAEFLYNNALKKETGTKVDF